MRAVYVVEMEIPEQDSVAPTPEVILDLQRVVGPKTNRQEGPIRAAHYAFGPEADAVMGVFGL